MKLGIPQEKMAVKHPAVLYAYGLIFSLIFFVIYLAVSRCVVMSDKMLGEKNARKQTLCREFLVIHQQKKTWKIIFRIW
jgi:hypothetical protein